MRKMVILLAVLLPMLVTMAHDVGNQPPIIAMRENKLYSVSPVDGAATVIVAPAADEAFTWLEDNDVSRDRKWLAYVIEKRIAEMNNISSNLFLMNLETGKVDVIKPSGGVFDRPLPATHLTTMNLPTWSYDGSRLYYVLSEIDTRGTGAVLSELLTYYDIAQGEHHLVGRLDPKNILEGLWAVESGVIVRSFKRGSDVADVTLYAPDNSIIKQIEGISVMPTPVAYEGQTYYAELSIEQEVVKLTNVVTGEIRDMTGIAYPAAASLSVGRTVYTCFWSF